MNGRRRLAAGGIAVLLAVLSAIQLSRMPFTEDIADLLPVSDRVIGEQFAFLSATGTVNTVVVDLALAGDDGNFADLAAAGRTVEAQVRESGLFDTASTASPADFMALRRLLIRHWPNLFSVEDSLWLARRMSPDSLHARLDRSLSALFVFSDRSSGTFTLKHDPFGFADVVYRRLSALRPARGIDFKDGFITNTDGDRILIPLRMPSGVSTAQAQRLREVMEESARLAARGGVDLTWMSAARATLDNSETVRRDVYLTAPLTVAFILLLCFLVYRRPWYGLAVFVPTVLGIALTLAAATLAQQLSIIVLGFGAALLGITIDYAVHYFYHIENKPEDRRPARTLAPAILASALTTAGAFAALLAARIPGLSQLGAVTAVGILMVAGLSLVLLPALFAPARSWREPRVKLTRLFEWFYGRRLHVSLALPVGVISVILWAMVPRLSFEGDPDHLNGMRPATVKAEALLQREWEGVAGGAYCVVTASSENGVRRRAQAQLVPLIDFLAKQETIYPAAVFTALLPPNASQRDSRERWRAFWTGGRRRTMHEAIDRVAARYGLPSERFHGYVAGLPAIDSLPLLGLAMFPEAVRRGALGNAICRGDSVWYGAVPVIGRSDSSWRRIALAARRRGVLAVNDEILGLRLVDIVKERFVASLVYIPLVIVLVLALILRSAALVFIALVPPLLSTGMTLGGMAAIGLPVNIVTFMVLAFIFGLGIDYTVFVLHLSRVGGEGGAAEGAASVTVAALTTLAGLGAMVFARHPALSILGTAGVMGIGASYVCAIVFVPLLNPLVRRFRRPLRPAPRTK